MSFLGKVKLVKQVILPILLFWGVVYPPSWIQCRKIQRQNSIFFWGSKTEQVIRKQLYKMRECGGWELPDTDFYLCTLYKDGDERGDGGGWESGKFLQVLGREMDAEFGIIWDGRMGLEITDELWEGRKLY